MLKRLQLSVLFGLAFASQSVPSLANEYWTELSGDSHRHQLAYSTCSPDECFGEGVTHVLGCDQDADYGFRFAYVTVVSDSRNLTTVTELGSLPWDDQILQLELGRLTATAQVYEMNLSRNDMNGAWDLTLRFSEAEQFWGSLSHSNKRREALLKALDIELPLSPNRKAADELIELARRCSPQAD
ncbi:hypothetical protein [Devosia sp. SD17-2]|uniref:hypothetical protein n=1 Tax=Devosia sp. SD17-2 TaxID=2976459 RepID=UPI0023D828D3|nr:hypothetical protein [Devosia sp. SD17-2]WEJ31630.1 hypothetical protein NYQ88_11990 [Devosia sp. SD17-2]